jgi:hypothetical protein
MDKQIECDHEGKWFSAGIVPITGQDQLTFFVIMFCKKCGNVQARKIDIKGMTIARPMPSQIVRPR